MPRYDYKCINVSCNAVIEVIEPFSADKDHCCSKCGCLMRRQLGTFGGFDLRGEGFFKNDYPKDDQKS